MSLDLDVKLTKEIRLDNLLSNSKSEMIKLTNFYDIPELQGFLLKSGSKAIPKENYVLKPDDVIIIKFQDISEEVNLIIIEMECMPLYVTEDEAGVWAGISIQGDNIVKTFLALGIALSLSALCDSNITDERNFWCGERESSYNSFLAKMNNKKLLNAIQKSSDFKEFCKCS